MRKKIAVFLIVVMFSCGLSACSTTVNYNVFKETKDITEDVFKENNKNHETENTTEYKPDNNIDDNMDIVKWEYSWKLLENNKSYKMTLDIDMNKYKYYHSLKRKSLIESGYFKSYLMDEYNLQLAKRISNLFLTIQDECNFSTLQLVNEVAHFVHTLCTYETDKDYNGTIEYPKYLIETLIDERGDCEDTTIFIASIVKEMGFDTVFFLYDDHIMVGVLGGEGVTGDYVTIGDKKYFCLETTANGYTIGVMPEEYKYKTPKVINLN